jgi:quercetin dioxygenase-like cupin family protein
MKTIVLDFNTQDWKPHEKFTGLYTKPFLSGKEGFGFKSYLVRVLPGAEIPVHTHDVTEIFLIYSGTGTAYVEGEYVEVSGGTIIAAPAGKEHGMKNTGSQEMIILANFES